MSQDVTVRLADHWLVYAQARVDAGRFESLDHAMEHALRVLEASEDREDRLARLLEEGEQSGDAGPWDYQEFLTEMHELDGERQAA